MAMAPTHCINIIVSCGIRIAALIIATTTSDMVRMPTRPGNSICEILKIMQKQGRKITMDQKAAVGKAVLIITRSGSGSTWRIPAKMAEMAVVDKKINVASGSIGILGQRFRVATPMAQKIPDNKL